MLKQFLQAYTTDRTAAFPDRSRQAKPILEAILNNPLVVLHGPVGCGKTSLTQTQIATDLKKKGFQVYFVNFDEDPLEETRAVLFGVPVNQLTTQQRKRSLQNIIHDISINQAPIVLFFDPLEYLIELNHPKVVSDFFDKIATIMRPPSSPTLPEIHLVFVVRTDFLSSLKKTAPPTLGLESAVKFEIPHLDHDEALSSLQSFSKNTKFEIASDLHNKLILDYHRNNFRTADFQLLLRRLYDEACDLPATGNKVVIQTPLYQATGGILEITRNFLNYEIDWIVQFILAADTIKLNRRNLAVLRTPDMVLRQEALYRYGIRLILGSLITAKGIPAPTSRHGLIQRVLAQSQGLSRRMLYRLMAGLDKRGLLQVITNDEIHVALSSGFLAPLVFRLVESNSSILDQCKLQDQLRLFSSECRASNHVFPPFELTQISAQADRLAIRNQELIWCLNSSLINKISPEYWYGRVKNEGLHINQIIGSILDEADYQESICIAQSFYKIGQETIPWLILLLENPYPQVRAYAIGALEKLDATGEWRQNLIHESFISGGSFIMGITPGNFIDESYEHYVEVEGFYISKSPVTFENYYRFMKSKEEPDDFIPGLERHPKVDLTWFEAIEYTFWANSRLPSEAEWEKAASWLPPAISPNSKKRRYPWGDQFIENNCNMSTSKINRTTPVGKYSPRGDSGYGCMDMAGNVWEWTNTIYRPYPYLISDGREVNTTVGSRVIRGGSYQSGPSYVTCTVRQAFNPYSKRKDIGLRCVLVIPDADQW